MTQTNLSRLIPGDTITRRFYKAIKKYWPLYLMLVPGLAFFFIYKYLPIWGIQIAFKDFAIRKGISDSLWKSPWYYWFQYFFKSPSSKQIIFNTLILSGWKLIVGMIPPLIFALAVSESRFKKFCRVVQTVSYLPHFLSWVIVYGICVAMLSESTGIVNMIFKKMGLGTIPFLTSNTYFRGVLIASDLWKSLGWSSIVYLAVIMGIDTTMYEAATIDGCGRYRRIWYITLPSLAKIFVVLLIMRVGKILDAGFNQVYVFMNSRVQTSAEIIDTWVYTEGLGKMKYSMSTAVGLMKSVLSCVLVLGTNAIARKWESSLW